MKLMHLADLHIGKRVHGFSMLKDQQYILEQILSLVDEEQPDCVLMAGDIYDKPVPSAEAVTVFDDFLAGLYGRQTCVCLISGNHDSAERLDFGGRIFESQDIHVAGRYDGQSSMAELQDEHGPVRIWLLPFVRPMAMRPYAPEVHTYQEAVEAAVEKMKESCGSGKKADQTKEDMAFSVYEEGSANESTWNSARNVLVAHQFVINGGQLPEVCESEELSLGTLDHVDVSIFDDFDYVALGHLHGPQQVGRGSVRYAGSPLKYSFSERHHKKSVTIVELGEKGQVEIRQIPLRPMHDLRQIQGTMEELLEQGMTMAGRDADRKESMDGINGTGDGNCPGTDPRLDYICAVLTDEGQIYDALGRLRAVYPNLMRLEFARESREFAKAMVAMEQMRSLTAMELFEEFYEKQRQQPLSQEARQVVEDMLEELTHGKGGDRA